MLLQPIKAGTEVCPSASDRVKMNGLPSEVRLRLLHFCVEVQDMDSFWPLVLEDRPDLGFKKPQLPTTNRTEAIDSNRDLPDALAHDAR
jgi:hypothetical protein